MTAPDWQAILVNDRVAAALVTALVGGGVVAAGWFWTHALSRHRDRVLRREKVADIQRALLAEIRAHVVVLEVQSGNDSPWADSEGADLPGGGYLPILPHDANDRIFRAVVEEVHILPEWTIDPVVRYYRLLAVRAALAQDIRANTEEHPDRAARMFRDYLEINDETLGTGIEAMEVLTASLSGGKAAVTRYQLRREQALAAEMAAGAGAGAAASAGPAVGVSMRSADRSDQ